MPRYHYNWDEHFTPGDLALVARPYLVSSIIKDTGRMFRLKAGTLLTITKMKYTTAEAIYGSDVISVPGIDDVCVNLTHAKPLLAGKHFVAINQLSRQHAWFAAKIKSMGGMWSDRFTPKCTHVLTRFGDPNAIQYSYARKLAVEHKKTFVSEAQLAEMMGYTDD